MMVNVRLASINVRDPVMVIEPRDGLDSVRARPLNAASTTIKSPLLGSGAA